MSDIITGSFIFLVITFKFHFLKVDYDYFFLHLFRTKHSQSSMISCLSCKMRRRREIARVYYDTVYFIIILILIPRLDETLLNKQKRHRLIRCSQFRHICVLDHNQCLSKSHITKICLYCRHC